MKKKMSFRCVICLIAVMSVMVSLLAGCGESSSAGKYDSASSEAGMAAPEASDEYYYDGDYEEAAIEYDEGFSNSSEGAEDVEVTEGAKSNRKLIRTVHLNVETYDFASLTASIPGNVNALGGYIESSSVDGIQSSYGRSASYTLRIPAAKADTFIASLGDDSNITHQEESMEDVTLQYVDINSRKGSLQVEYDRLEELLKDAEDIEELIYIENRLSEVRYEIESIESQLRSYDNLVDYTTIYLYVSEVYEYSEPEPVDNSVGTRISRGLKTAFENITDFLSGLLVVIVVAIPYLFVIAVFVVIIWLIVKLIMMLVRKHREKHPKQQPAPMPMPMFMQPGMMPMPGMVPPAGAPVSPAKENADEAVSNGDADASAKDDD